MKTVFVAGATGYLGRHVVNQYMSMGWHVRALVRNADRALASGLSATEIFEGEATNPLTLCGAMNGVDLVISTLGITRQRDGLSYWDVDFQANVNLLSAALDAKVDRFAYVHVLNADRMANVPLVAAKSAFAARLEAAPIKSTIIAPSGFYSDMGDFLDMAKRGRVWLFGSGDLQLNPIDGADLATVISDAIWDQKHFITVGGPETFTQKELATAAFAALGKTPRITRLPDVLRRFLLRILPFVTRQATHGPVLFFLTALGMDMVGTPSGSKRLRQHFADLVANDATRPHRVTKPKPRQTTLA